MFFNPYDVYENKLSEKLPDDNPYKKKLIEMETPKDKHPIYSTLVFFLLIYCWGYTALMFYYQVYGYQAAFITMFFTSVCLFFTYKRDFLTDNTDKTHKYIMFLGFTAMFSPVIFYTKIFQTHPQKELFFNSYIFLSCLAFFLLGVSLTYIKCPYYMYRVFYSQKKTYPKFKNEELLIRENFPIMLLACIGFCFAAGALILNTSNPEVLKDIPFCAFFSPPNFYYNIIARKYVKTYNKAQHLSDKGKHMTDLSQEDKEFIKDFFNP